MRLGFANPFRDPDTKASRAGALIALLDGGRPRWTPRDYAGLAREGFALRAFPHGNQTLYLPIDEIVKIIVSTS